MARQIVVEVTGDASGLARATATATEHVGKFNSFLTGIAQGVGQQAYGAVTSAIDTVISKVKESDQVFRDDQASIEKVNRAVENAGSAFNGSSQDIEGWVNRAQRLGFQASEVRDSIGLLVGVTHNLATAQSDEALAEDLARAKGISLAAATEVLTKAREGNYKGLKSLGIAIETHEELAARTIQQQNSLTLAQMAYTDAVRKHGARSEEAHKAAMHLQDVQASLNKLVKEAVTPMQALDAVYRNVKGQAEGFANTSEGRLEAAQAKNTASWVKIGAIVDRISSVVLPIAADALGKVADAVGPLADKLGQFFNSKEFTDFWAQAQPVLKELGEELGKDLPPMFVALAGAAKAVLPVMGFLFKVWGAVVVPEIKGITIAITAASNAIRAIATVVGQVVPAVSSGFNSIAAAVSGMPGRISGASGRMWDGIKNSFRAVLNAIIGMWNHLEFKLPKIDAGPIHTPSFDLKVPQIPYFHSGGVVPGAPGSEVLAMLQAGERVTPAGGSNGPQTVIHITIGSYVGDASTLSRMLAKELRLTGVAFR